jgi:ABC-2 type transport system ATP-binding protein
MGLLEPPAGNITLDGKKIDYSVTDKIGFLTEERSLLTKLKVSEQVLYYGTLKGMDKETILKRLDELLAELEITEYKDTLIKELSKGNQQKIQFITAIINEPKLLILDEPFSGLDPFNVEMFKKVIQKLAKKGSIIIFSSHRMEHVELFCKKIVILLNGKSVLEGELADIKKKYKKKNIFIKGDIDVDSISKIDGVISVEEYGDSYLVKIKDDSITSKVFDKVKKCKNITKFELEDASLNEIFVAKVGESYEK